MSEKDTNKGSYAFEGLPGKGEGREAWQFREDTEGRRAYALEILTRVKNDLLTKKNVAPADVQRQLFEWLEDPKMKDDTQFLKAVGTMLESNKAITMADLQGLSAQLDMIDSLDGKLYDNTFNTLNESNKWGVLSGYIKHFDDVLRKEGVSDSFASFLDTKAFTYYDTRAKKWKNAPKGLTNKSYPEWDKNYFSLLRNLYIDFIQNKIDTSSLKNSDRLLACSVQASDLVKTIQEFPFCALTTDSNANNLTAGLLRNHLHTETPRVLDTIEKKIFEQEQYMSALGGNIHTLVTKNYPIKDFNRSASGKKFHDSHKKLRGRDADEPYEKEMFTTNKPFLKAYYTWVLDQAKDAKDDETIIIAQTWLDLFDRGKEHFSVKEEAIIKKAVMKSFFDKKMDLLVSSGYEDNLRYLLKKQGLSNKEIDTILDNYKQFWKNYFDLDCTKHYLTDVDGSEIPLTINKKLRFTPSKRVEATNLSDLFTLEVAYKPNQAEGNETIAKFLGSDDIWSDHFELKRKHSTQPEKLHPQKSQKYRMYGPNGEVKEGYLGVGVFEPDEPIGEDGKEKPLTFQAYFTKLFYPSSIPESKKEYPFAKQGAKKPADAFKGWGFDPIDDKGNIVDHEYRVLLNGGDSNQSRENHCKKVESFLTGKILHDAASKNPDDDAPEIKDYGGDEFDKDGDIKKWFKNPGGGGTNNPPGGGGTNNPPGGGGLNNPPGGGGPNTPPNGPQNPPEDGNDDPEDGNDDPEDGNDTPEDGNDTPEDGNDTPEDGNDTPEDGNDTPEDEGGGPEDEDERPEYGSESPEHLEGGFDDKYSQLPGDKEVAMNGPNEGDILFAKDSSSNRPGGKSDRMQFTVTKVTDDKITVKLTSHTEKDPGKFLGQENTLPRNKEGFDALEKVAKGKLFVYREVKDKNDFLSYAKSNSGTELPDLWDGVKDGKKSYSVNDKSKTGPVTHVARLSKDPGSDKRSDPIYEVNRKGNSVELTSYLTKETDDETGKPIKQEKIVTTMDYTSFIHFCKDKELSPYTKEEIDNSGKHNRKSAANDPKLNSRRDNFVSINMILAMFKKIPETFNAKREKEKEIQSAILLKGFLNAIPSGIDGGLLYLDSMQFDAVAESDATIMKVINDFKDRLGRNDIGDGVHGGKGTELIEKEIFEKKISTRMDRLKTAGYLLYALENGGQPYPRKLIGYVGTGLWVEKLLGEEHKEDFLKEYKGLLDQYKGSKKGNIELQDRIAKAELRYIKDRTTDHWLYGSRYGRAVEKHMDDRGKANDIDQVKNGVAGKGNFYDIYEAIWGGGMGNLLPHVFMGGLLALEEAVENDEHYKMFYQVVVAALASGYTKQFSKAYINKFQALCRRRGVPIGMFVNDGGSMTKTVGLIDYIAKENNIESLYDKIKKKTDGEWDPRDPKFPGKDRMDIRTFNTGLTGKYSGINGNKKSKMARKVMSIVGDRRQVHGEKVMSEFNSDPSVILKGLADGDTYVEDYFSDDVVFDSYGDYKESGTKDMGDGESPFHDGIFNLNPGVFASYMLEYNGRNFRANQSADMWQQLRTTINNFGGIVTMKEGDDKKPLLKVLLKKWKLYFGKKLGDSGLRYMKKQLLLLGTGKGAEAVSNNLDQLNEISFKGQYRYSLDTRTNEINANKHKNNYGYPPEAPQILDTTVTDYKNILVEGLAALSEGEKNKLVNDIFDMKG